MMYKHLHGRKAGGAGDYGKFWRKLQKQTKDINKNVVSFLKEPKESRGWANADLV